MGGLKILGEISFQRQDFDLFKVSLYLCHPINFK